MKKLLDNIKKWIESLFKDKDFNDDEVVFSTEEYIEDEEDNSSFSLWYGEIKREYRNIKWVWHKNDEDMWPSFPHLHALERPYKMDIYTGTIYNKQKQDIDKLSSKEMNFLWKDKKFLSYVNDKRDYYEKFIYDGNRYKPLPKCPYEEYE